jgi:hypothetical protein
VQLLHLALDTPLVLRHYNCSPLLLPSERTLLCRQQQLLELDVMHSGKHQLQQLPLVPLRTVGLSAAPAAVTTASAAGATAATAVPAAAAIVVPCTP